MNNMHSFKTGRNYGEEQIISYFRSGSKCFFMDKVRGIDGAFDIGEDNTLNDRIVLAFYDSGNYVDVTKHEIRLAMENAEITGGSDAEISMGI